MRMEAEFPKLACPLTATNHTESHAVALVQYRTRNELGIAALNLHRPELVLFQFTDNQTFSNTMRLLNFFDPQEIILPHSCGTGSLFIIFLIKNEKRNIHNKFILS